MGDSSNINHGFYKPLKQPTSYNRKINLSVNVNGNTILNSNRNANLNIKINHNTKLNPNTDINITANDDLTNNVNDGAYLYEDDFDINIKNRLAEMDRRVQEMYTDVCDMQAAGGELFPPPPPRLQDLGNRVSDSEVAPAADSQPRQNTSSRSHSVLSTIVSPSPVAHQVSMGPQSSSNSDSSIPEPPKTAHNSNSCLRCCILRSLKWCRCKCHIIEKIGREEGICPYYPTSSHQDESLDVFNNLLNNFSSEAPEIKVSASEQQFNSNVPISINYNFDARKALWKVLDALDVIQLKDSLQKLLTDKYCEDCDCRVAANFLVDIIIPGYFWGRDRYGDEFEPTLPMPPKDMKEKVVMLLAIYSKPVASTVSSGARENGDIQSCEATPTSSSTQQAQTQAAETASSPTTVQEESASEPIYIPGGKMSQWNHKRRNSLDSFDMGPPSPGSSIYEESSETEFEPKSYESFDLVDVPELSPSYKATIAGQNPENIPIWWGLGDRAPFSGPDMEGEHDDVLKHGWTFPKRMSIPLYSDSDYGELEDEERWDKLVVNKPEIVLSRTNTGWEEVEMTTVLAAEKKISNSTEPELEDGEVEVTCALVEKKRSNYESPSVVSDDGED